MAKLKKLKKLIPGKDKNKKKVKASEEASPLIANSTESQSSTSLMANSTKSKSSASSPRFEMENDKEREEKKKQRDERRKQRDQRLADSNTTKESSSKTKKKKPKPKLTQEEQDAKDAKLGCCHYFQEVLVKIVHVIDAAIGLTFLIYGCLINAEFANPAMDAVIPSVAFGATMLLTSIMGAIGFYTKLCWRVGLLLSAYTAVLIAFFYTFIIIALLGAKDTYFNYLKENKSVLYLDDDEIAILQQILPFFYIALASLAAIETVRFFALRKLRGELVRSDAASMRISARLAEPLIGDEQV
eukprot:CAMPEP_0201631708 /NCGR_PEP_ID=MMETSP0493-20130528/5592_1 /ASSEMBLY_ACC=CAM_ASM_000838 /TAXON_ID=420259 /ORGANISM="Thalassiosira gravida, Strain GMp14c1" /LENGTH=299 /DNA_ID=CAMNT_0048103089 /DNA_START=99 /DNA_END=998 /DNA_ORIENTATION=+